MTGRVACSSKHRTSLCRVIGELERAGEMEGATVFEVKQVRTGEKRKREDKGDPGDTEGYMGPWRGYVDQVRVAKPTPEQMAVLEEQFKDRRKMQKKKNDEEEEEVFEESTLLHGEV